MRKVTILFCLASLLVFTGCHQVTVDVVAARKLSDEFMSDMIAHHADAALDKMESEFRKEVNRSDFASQVEKLSQYCGWPLDSELKGIQPGFKTFIDGHTNPTLRFTYATATNQAPKGQCFFSIEIAQAGNTVSVTSFGPLK
ncbi:MAG: hypothetical protein WCE52_23025 [Candidatus Acidiferrum sp.]